MKKLTECERPWESLSGDYEAQNRFIKVMRNLERNKRSAHKPWIYFTCSANSCKRNYPRVECDVIDGGRASQLSTHPPTCAEGATLETGSGDSSAVSNLLSHLCLYRSGGGGNRHENGGFS